MWEFFYILCTPSLLTYNSDSCELVREYMPNPAYVEAKDGTPWYSESQSREFETDAR